MHPLKTKENFVFSALVASLDEQCCVDVTPGYKPFSIAAATLTFNRRLHFSYVTIGGKVIFYDADLTIVGYDLS